MNDYETIKKTLTEIGITDIDAIKTIYDAIREEEDDH